MHSRTYAQRLCLKRKCAHDQVKSSSVWQVQTIGDFSSFGVCDGDDEKMYGRKRGGGTILKLEDSVRKIFLSKIFVLIERT